jgi:uncharacterized protein YlbG (UPF0298 family)
LVLIKIRKQVKQVKRYADITYSFNSSSNVNRLNEFNLSLANFKDDIDKSYGPIYKMELIPTFKFVKKTRTPKYSTVKTFFIMQTEARI